MFNDPERTEKEPKRWTVMLYMAAEQDAQTESAAIDDILELQRVGTTRDINVLVQIDRRWPGYAERYCVYKGKSEPCEPCNELVGKRNINSGEATTLSGFLDWARINHPAEHSLLVLWGHAYGLGFGRDHGDALTMPEIAKALYGRGIDILGANACAVSYAEAAYELRDAATFLVAPEITMPFAGWPYAKILTELEKPGIEPRAVAEKIISGFLDSFGREGVALTLLNLKKAQELRPYVQELALVLHEASQKNGARDKIADAFLDTAHGHERPIVDLADLCGRLAENLTDRDEIVKAAMQLRAFLEPGVDEFVIKHEKDEEFEGLHGVGIYAPAVTGDANLTRLEFSEGQYSKLQLIEGTEWATVVYRDVKAALAPVIKEVAEFVKAIGATDVADRTGVAQLLVGVHQSFVRLETTLKNTETEVLGAFDGNGAGILNVQGLRNPAVAARLSAPYLRLADPAPQYEAAWTMVSKLLMQSSSVSEGEGQQAAVGRVKPLAESLRALEDALASVEKTAKKVLTHSTFGLGGREVKPGLGAREVKPGLGDREVKPGLGGREVKPGLGGREVKPGLGGREVKPGLGILDWLIAANGDDVDYSGGVVNVTGLFGQVAWSLQLLEEAVAKLEGIVRSAVTGSTYESKPGDSEYRQRSTEQVQQSFRELKEVVTNAKRTVGGVLANPADGLGPVSQVGLGLPSRQQLALAGGLSPRNLRLLRA